MKRALITGITGQDGSYLAELLLSKGYRVFGFPRRSSSERPVAEGVEILYGDMTDEASLHRALAQAEPDEVYNLAAQSHVHVSFQVPVYSCDVTGLGCVRLLECIRLLGLPCRFYQASTSELFGDSREPYQTELTPFRPRSPYACAKALAHHAAVNYRESYGMHVSCGILFNHSSPRRSEQFVERKITRAVATMEKDPSAKLHLGNIDAQRDWGFAGDYVQAMWMMLQQDKPSDYVIATGESHAVREILEIAFGYVGKRWQDHVVHAAALERPSDVAALRGCWEKAGSDLGWTPRVEFAGLIAMLMEHDLRVARG